MLTSLLFPLLLGARLCFAIPHNARALITAAPLTALKPQATLVPRWPVEPYCTTLAEVVSVISVMEHPPEPFIPLPFCSALLQPYQDVYTYTTLLGPVTKTSTISTTTRTTTTDTLSHTTTILCPTPSPSALCGITGTFTSQFLEHNIFHHENGVESGAACKQKCLGDERCKSFVTYDSSWGGSSCDMYNATLAEGFAGRGTGNDAGPDHWFDRACPNLLPSACLAPPVPATTTPPALLQKRVDIPTWLNDFWVYGGCSCLITSASPTIFQTILIPIDSQSYTTTASTQTATQTSTSLLHLTTSYTFVARN